MYCCVMYYNLIVLIRTTSNFAEEASSPHKLVDEGGSEINTSSNCDDDSCSYLNLFLNY